MATEDQAPERCHSILNRKASPSRAKERAAITIQKSYRGYRERRQGNGLRLDASTRWSEAMKEVKYRQALRPLSRDRESTSQDSRHEHAMSHWRLATEAVRHAASDDTSDTDGEEGISAEELAEYRTKKAEARRKMVESSKMMDLQYWLEMVDTKHRYGANLKAYHSEWQKSDTHENFFFWLDHGEGKHMEMPTISREMLESMQVRYLSREERRQYLVTVDSEGYLVWAKNGERISTTTEFKDSVEGVVRVESDTPTWSSPTRRRPGTSHSWSTSSGSSVGSQYDGEPYATPELKRAKGFKKLKQISPATILNQLLLKTIKPNTWIFVADTSFRLYVGIKESGTFQHSSFLQGARISSAGLIKIKDGQLRKLSPLSGHYRAPTKNFRMFMKSLKDAGVDTSKLSISRSYAVLLGLETYNRSRKAIRNGISHVLHPTRYAHSPKRKSLSLNRRSVDLGRKMDGDEAAQKHTMVLPDRTRPLSADGEQGTKAAAGLPEILVQQPSHDHTPADEISTGILVDTRHTQSSEES